MALFKPYKCTNSQLNSLPIKEGQLIFVTDTKKLYIDITNSSRVQVMQDEINKLSGIEAQANKYVLPIASSTLGGVKTTSTKSDLTDYEPAPIDNNGVVYTKNAPSITEFDQFTALFHYNTGNATVVAGNKIRVSKTQPTEQLAEGDVWMVVED